MCVGGTHETCRLDVKINVQHETNLKICWVKLRAFPTLGLFCLPAYQQLLLKLLLGLSRPLVATAAAISVLWLECGTEPRNGPSHLTHAGAPWQCIT